jgi:hypothetical protein
MDADMGGVEDGPPVNLLSAAQLRFLGRIKGLRPNLVLAWEGDAQGWSLDVTEPRPDAPGAPLLTARFERDGTVRAKRSWL